MRLRISFGASDPLTFWNASRNAATSPPAVMRPFRSSTRIPSRSLLTISRFTPATFRSFSLSFGRAGTQLFQLLFADFRKGHLQRLHSLNHHLRDGMVPKPLVIGRNNVPGRGFGRTLRNGIFIRVLIFLPVAPFREIGGRRLPVLVRVVQPFLETLLLFIL